MGEEFEEVLLNVEKFYFWHAGECRLHPVFCVIGSTHYKRKTFAPQADTMDFTTHAAAHITHIQTLIEQSLEAAKMRRA
jgi:hypothetical protein